MAGFFERLTEPLENLETQKIRKVCSAIEGVTPIAELQPRKRYKIAGLVQNMRIDPSAGSPTLDVTLNDGTGLASAQWYGRLRIPGIDVGRYITVEGTAIPGRHGELMFLNPYYELMPED